MGFDCDYKQEPEFDCMTELLWDRETFVEKMRAVGARAYHDKHPFHVAMNEGRLAPEGLRVWVANRFYYQRNIPIKDAAILSNCPAREVRRIWIHRIQDHDGTHTGERNSCDASDRGFSGVRPSAEGGIEAWLRLGEACGLPRHDLMRDRDLLPGVRFAVDAYVNFARTRPWMIAIASSLTELFAPNLMNVRLAAFKKFYPWIDTHGLDYFQRRVTQARQDSGEALAITVEYCNTPELQREAVGALEFKCDVLWSMLDAIHHANLKPNEERSAHHPRNANLGGLEAAAS
jgi:pyrroloquinoline-quinone synthase